MVGEPLVVAARRGSHRPCRPPRPSRSRRAPCRTRSGAARRSCRRRCGSPRRRATSSVRSSSVSLRAISTSSRPISANVPRSVFGTTLLGEAVAGQLRDVLGHVAHALERRADAQRADDDAQVAGDRLLAGEDVDGQLVEARRPASSILSSSAMTVSARATFDSLNAWWRSRWRSATSVEISTRRSCTSRSSCWNTSRIVVVPFRCRHDACRCIPGHARSGPGEQWVFAT